MPEIFQLVFYICLLACNFAVLSFELNTPAPVNLKGIWQGYIISLDAYNSGNAIHIKEQVGDRISDNAYIYRNEDPLMADGIPDFTGAVNLSASKITELAILKEKIPFKNYRALI